MNPPRHQQELRKQQYTAAMGLFEARDHAGAAAAFAAIGDGSDLLAQVSRYYAGECYLRVGLERMRSSQFAEAANCFIRAEQHNPQHSGLPRYLACCFAQLGRFDQAARHSDREVSHGSNPCAARMRLVLSLWCDGQQLAALQALRDALSVDPQQVEFHYQLGVLLGAREEYAEAVVALEQAVILQPDHAESLMHLGLCYGARGRPLQAVEALSAAQRLRPRDPQIARLLAQAAAALGTLPTAGDLVQLPLAMPAIDVQDIEELTRMIRNEPEVAEAFAGLPDVNDRDNIFQLLAAVLDRAILAEPQRAELHYHQAQMFDRLGRQDLAIASCERAVEIAPKLVQGLITLGKLYLRTNRRLDAQARFQQVLQMGYDYADVHYLLGCIYRDEGHKQQARESYRKALQINAGYRAAREALASLAA